MAHNAAAVKPHISICLLSFWYLMHYLLRAGAAGDRAAARRARNGGPRQKPQRAIWVNLSCNCIVYNIVTCCLQEDLAREGQRFFQNLRQTSGEWASQANAMQGWLNASLQLDEKASTILLIPEFCMYSRVYSSINNIVLLCGHVAFRVEREAVRLPSTTRVVSPAEHLLA